MCVLFVICCLILYVCFMCVFCVCGLFHAPVCCHCDLLCGFVWCVCFRAFV